MLIGAAQLCVIITLDSAAETGLDSHLCALRYVVMAGTWAEDNAMTAMFHLGMGTTCFMIILYSCGHTCAVETGWSCIGGGAAAADVCTEICGDTVDWGTLPCEDGVLGSGGYHHLMTSLQL